MATMSSVIPSLLLALFSFLWMLPAPAAVAHAQSASAKTPSKSPKNAKALRRSDSTDAPALLQVRVSEFHALWQRAWRDSERYRQRYQARQVLDSLLRSKYEHCHPDGSSDFRNTSIKVVNPEGGIPDEFTFRVISDRSSYFAICPSWLLSEGVELAMDETAGRDGALIDSLRPLVYVARQELLRELDSSAVLLPANLWLTNQRVRLHVDQGDTSGAFAAAASCKVNTWWCLGLKGYVNAQIGRMFAAETTFAAMRAAMPTEIACEWNDIRLLLDEKDRGSYVTLTCQQQTAFNTRFWWLADPLFRAPVNERRVTDDARRVEVAMHQNMVYDERYSWDQETGGGAFANLITRFGWPTYTANMVGINSRERGHTGWLNDDGYRGAMPPDPAHVTVRRAPYTTFEYAMDRVHTAPTSGMVLAPFAIVDSMWELRKEDADGTPQTRWWPTEHYFPSTPLVQLFEGQTGLFRRQSQILIASAIHLNHPALATSLRAPYDVMMLSSTGPRQMDSLVQVADTAGGTAVLQGLIAPGPQLIAIEAVGSRNNPIAARSRFGVTAPMPLDSMKPGELAVSEPVLLDATTVSNSASGDDVLERLLPSTTFSLSKKRFDVYWETYGLTNSDTVTVFVRLIGDRDVNIARQVGVALGVVGDPNGTIVQEWTEPNGTRDTRTLEGPVPVQMRSITLNVEQVTAGPYILEVGIRPKSGAAVTGRQRIRVVP